jgi:hypothetical protein
MSENFDAAGQPGRPDWMPPPPKGEDQERRGAGTNGPDPDEIRIVPAISSEIQEIPPRPWAYGHFLMFGTAAVIGAMDGAGKGMIAVGIALSFITGEKLLGEHVWRPGRVVILTYEDDEAEWRRRIAAACLLHKLDYKTVLRGIHFLVRPSGRRVILAERSTGRDATVIFPDHDRIVAQLKALDTALFIIDPFNNAHSLDDGNNNALVATVAHEISTIARDANVAVLLLHHLRKGAVGNVDDLMGAVALRANFRACRIMQVMLAEMAEQLGIKPDQAWRYLRVVGSKENYAPPLDKSMWFHKASILLNNPAGIYTKGDEVGAIERWEPPLLFDGLDYAKLRSVFDTLAARPHSPVRKTKAIPWAGRPLLDLGKTDAQAIRILAEWLKNGVLVHGDPFKTEDRKDIQTVTPDPAKVAAILEPLRPPGQADGLPEGPPDA